jgi:hypothetical protein
MLAQHTLTLKHPSLIRFSSALPISTPYPIPQK